MKFSACWSFLFFKNKYTIYFFVLMLLIFLSIVPFYMVINKIFSKIFLFFIVMICLFLQILIQMKFFLHLNFSKEQRWKLLSMIFSLVIGGIILLGSIWILNNLNNHLCIS